MKTETRNLHVHTNTETFNYTVEANAELFKLLIDDLYSDKIGSLLRELGANAVDSHIQAGHNKPFDIHLPNSLEPWFAIRDYGVGLNGEEIRSLYTRLGASSKRDSNDFIGCIGIGSKSPFAYTNSFMVTSYKDGKKWAYSAFISQEGMPKLAIFEEAVDTTEENGLEVKLNVKQQDFTEFRNKAIQTYEYFLIKPKLLCDTKLQETIYLFKNNDFGLRETFSEGGPRVIMGGIKYRLSNQLDYPLNGYPLDLFFEIGELDITGNREDLQYNEKTKNAIKFKTKGIQEACNKHFSDNIKNCKTLYEAFLESLKYRKYCNVLYWTDQHDITHSLSRSLSLSTKNRLTYFPNYGKHYDTNELRINGPVHVFFNDLTRGAITRCDIYSKENNSAFLIFGQEDLTKAQEIGIPVQNASILPTKSFTRITLKRAAEIYEYIPRENEDNYLYRFWKKADKLPNDFFYVRVNRSKPLYKEKRIHPNYIKHIITLLNIDTVYGVTKKCKSGIELFDYFEKNFKVDIDYNKYSEYAYCDTPFKTKHYSGISKEIDEFNKKVELVNFNDLWKRSIAIKQLTDYFKFEPAKDHLNLDKEFEELQEKYKLIFQFSEYSVKKVKDHLKLYAKCIEDKHATVS